MIGESGRQPDSMVSQISARLDRQTLILSDKGLPSLPFSRRLCPTYPVELSTPGYCECYTCYLLRINMPALLKTVAVLGGAYGGVFELFSDQTAHDKNLSQVLGQPKSWLRSCQKVGALFL